MMYEAKKSKFDKKEVENIVNNLEFGFEKYNWDRHRTKGFEFDIKLRFLHLPEEVREFLDDETIYDIFMDESRIRLELLIGELKEKYDWIEDIFIEGRSGGWLVIVPKYDLYEEFIEDIYPAFVDFDSMDEEDLEDFFDMIRGQKKIFDDLAKIESKISKELKFFENELNNIDFWKNFI